MVLRRIGAVALAAILATSLAACGDDDGGDDGVSLEDADSSGSSSDTGDEGDEESNDGSDDGEAAGEVPDFGGAFGDCLEFVTAYGSLSLLFFGGAVGGGEDVDVDEVLSGIEEAAADAPDEVADALEVVANSYEEALDNLGGDLEGLDLIDPDTAEALEPLSSDDFNEANAVVSDYLDEICTPGG